MLGTIKDAVDELRAEGVRVGVLGITTFRPFPLDAVRDRARRNAGTGSSCWRGRWPRDRRHRDRRTPDGAGRRTASCTADTVIAGLGGRAITRRRCAACSPAAGADELEPLSFLDLDTGLVERELARMRASRRSGPAAENMLRDLGAVASRIG